MDMFEAAKRLYAVGYSHDEVRSIWAYAYNEKYLPEVGRRRQRWQARALEEADLTPQDIEFPFASPAFGVKGNYF